MGFRDGRKFDSEAAIIQNPYNKVPKLERCPECKRVLMVKDFNPQSKRFEKKRCRRCGHTVMLV